jgi:hypothetical protein
MQFPLRGSVHTGDFKREQSNMNDVRKSFEQGGQQSFCAPESNLNSSLGSASSSADC